MTTEVKTEGTPQASQQDVQTATLLFMMEEMRAMRTEIAALRAAPSVAPATKANGGTGTGRSRPQGSPHIDTKTGIVYKSKASAGKALFPEFEGRQLNDGRVVKMHGWIFHDIVALEPGRLIPYIGNKAHGEQDAEYVLERAEEAEVAEDETGESEDTEPAKTEPAKTEPQKPVAQQSKQPQAQQKPAQPQPKK